MDNQKPEVVKALEDVRKYGALQWPVGEDRAALCNAAIVLAPEFEDQARALSKLQGAVMALRMMVKVNPVAVLGCLMDDAAWKEHLEKAERERATLMAPIGEKELDEMLLYIEEDLGGIDPNTDCLTFVGARKLATVYRHGRTRRLDAEEIVTAAETAMIVREQERTDAVLDMIRRHRTKYPAAKTANKCPSSDKPCPGYTEMGTCGHAPEAA